MGTGFIRRVVGKGNFSFFFLLHIGSECVVNEHWCECMLLYTSRRSHELYRRRVNNNSTYFSLSQIVTANHTLYTSRRPCAEVTVKIYLPTPVIFDDLCNL